MFLFRAILLISLSSILAKGENLKLSKTKVAPESQLVASWESLETTPPAQLRVRHLNQKLDDKKFPPFFVKEINRKGQFNEIIKGPKEIGFYEVILVHKETLELLTPPIPFEVVGLSADPMAVKGGEKFKILFTMPDGEQKKAWIGFYKIDGAKDRQVRKINISDSMNGEIILSAPVLNGLYQLRYFANSQEIKELRSSTIPIVSCLKNKKTRSKIKHLIVMVQENHSFDSYFGRYCKAKTGSNPDCTEGQDCCEAGPEKDPGTGVEVRPLTEEDHMSFDPDHSRVCMEDQINGGKMDQYVSSKICGSKKNFTYAEESVAKPYWDLAKKFALADRYFQSAPGASSENDMYLAEARYVFTDNEVFPYAKGRQCSLTRANQYHHAMIGDLLNACGAPWTFYAEGYKRLTEVTDRCLGFWPKEYDASDIPINYYKSAADHPYYMRDYEEFVSDVKNQTLPAVVFIKGFGKNSEHPGGQIKMSDGMEFTSKIFDMISESKTYQENTLVLITMDEAGGYFDHVSPPPMNPIDRQPYGPRIFALALGHFAKRNYVSHLTMEHASILKFIEWNWLDGKDGQLGNREKIANNIGSLLDATKTGMQVPVH